MSLEFFKTNFRQVNRLKNLFSIIVMEMSMYVQTSLMLPLYFGSRLNQKHGVDFGA